MCKKGFDQYGIPIIEYSAWHPAFMGTACYSNSKVKAQFNNEFQENFFRDDNVSVFLVESLMTFAHNEELKELVYEEIWDSETKGVYNKATHEAVNDVGRAELGDKYAGESDEVKRNLWQVCLQQYPEGVYKLNHPDHHRIKLFKDMPKDVQNHMNWLLSYYLTYNKEAGEKFAALEFQEEGEYNLIEVPNVC